MGSTMSGLCLRVIRQLADYRGSSARLPTTADETGSTLGGAHRSLHLPTQDPLIHRYILLDTKRHERQTATVDDRRYTSIIDF